MFNFQNFYYKEAFILFYLITNISRQISGKEKGREKKERCQLL